MIKLGFLGTPDISAYVLQKLVESGYEVSWVLTQPDRRSGRGLKMAPPPVKEKAQQLNIECFQSDKLDKDLAKKLLDRPVDLCVVIAYGVYIPSYFINGLKIDPLNIHVSLLPKYRGAAPVARAIMNGDNVTGVTIMQVAKEMDAGDILVQQEVEILNDDDTQTLTWRLVKKGVELLVSKIPSYVSGTIRAYPQSNTGIKPSYASKISSEERHIDWSENVKTIHDKVRAFYPWPTAETKINDTSIKIIKTSWDLCSVEGFEKGEIVEVLKKEGLIKVAGRDGVVLVEKVQPFGKREMTTAEFINGYKISKGMRFLNV